MDVSDEPDSDCSARKKQKRDAENSLLHLFVDYVIAQDSDTHTPEEIIDCVENVKNMTVCTMTPFQLVVQKKLTCLLPMLLACNDDVNFVGHYRQTILHTFVLHYTDIAVLAKRNPSKDREIVATLLERGAFVDAIDSRGNTPLHYAVANRRTDLVELMLKDFTKVNAVNCNSNAVLDLLIVSYREKPDDLQVEVIRGLVSKGADFKTPTNDLGMSPFDFAVKHCLIKILAIFKAKSDESDQELLLRMYSCANEWPDRPEELQHLDRLLNLSEIIDFRNEKHQLTPLHYASKFGLRSAVEVFVNAGADVNAVATDGLTPLHLAVMNGHSEVVKFLIDRGADLRARDTVFDFGLLHVAPFTFKKDIFNLLVKHGLDLEDQSRHGFTPLHIATMKGIYWMIKYLITHGVDVNCRTLGSQLTPLHLAAMKTNCAALIDQYKKETSIIYPLFASLIITKLKIVDSIIVLVKAGANVNARDSEFKTPLHYTVSSYGLSSSSDSLLTLLEYGAYVEVQDINGITPLSIAQRDSVFPSGLTTNMYSTLLRYGAEIACVNISDEDVVLSSIEQYVKLYGLVKHVTFIQAIGLSIKDNHKRAIEQSLRCKRAIDPEQLNGELMKLDEEIKKLKAHRFSIGGTTLYEFLHMNSRDRCYLARRVLSLDLMNEYPLCYIVIENSCRRAINEQLYFSLALSALNRLIKIHLPVICTDKIFDFMTTSEMTFFIHSMDNIEI